MFPNIKRWFKLNVLKISLTDLKGNSYSLNLLQ